MERILSSAKNMMEQKRKKEKKKKTQEDIDEVCGLVKPGSLTPRPI